MKKSSSSVQLVATVWLMPLLGVAGTFVSGCNTAQDDCVIGTQLCRCSATGACVQGLMCTANVCLPAVTTPGVDAGQPPSLGGGGSNGGGGVVLVPATPPTTTSTGRDAAPPPPVGSIDASASQPNLGGDAPAAPATGGTWTVFVYGHADHNLSAALARDLDEMNAAKLTPNVRVVMLADWDSTRTMEDKSKFPAGSFWYRIRGNDQPPELLTSGPELDLDDPNVLASSIRTAFTKFPSDRYALILWDHGGGWRYGFGGDRQNNTRKPAGLRFDTVAAAVRQAMTSSGLAGTRRLDFFAFDTCLLGMAEVATEFADVTKVFVGNAELDYGDGLDYNAALSWLSANPGATAQQFAVAESKTWDEHHKMAGISDQLFRSHLSIDMEKFAGVPGEFARLVTDARAGAGPALSRAFFESLPSYLQDDDNTASSYPPSRDVGLILERLKTAPQPAVAASAGRVLDLVNGAKIATVAGDLRQGQLGLGMFAGPLLKIEDKYFAQYSDLSGRWERGTTWGNMLGAAKAGAPTTEPTIMGEPVVPMAPSLADPPRINFEIVGSESAFMSMMLVEPDPMNSKRLFLYGTVAAAIVNKGPQVAKWSGRRTVLAGVTNPMPLTVVDWQYAVRGGQLSTGLRKVPGFAQEGGESMGFNLIVDDKGVAMAGEVVSEEGNFIITLARLYKALGPKGMFVPTLLTYDDVQKKLIWVAAEYGLYLQPEGVINFKEEVVKPGVWGIMMSADDIYGNTTVEPFAFILPASVTQ